MEYTVRESPKAKNARLKLSARDGLIVVVPKGFDRSRIPGLLEKRKAWLDKAFEKIEEQRKFFEPEPPGGMPERITLRAIGQEWSVDYRATESPWVTAVERKGNRLLVFGDIDDTEKCKKALNRWLSRKAHEHLVPWLRRIAEEKNFALNRVLVKSQRTRWASCSKHKTISINSKLLFIASHLVGYVFIHELCHTVHLNHSHEFWALVRDSEPRYQRFDSELRLVWRCLPAWGMISNNKV